MAKKTADKPEAPTEKQPETTTAEPQTIGDTVVLDSAQAATVNRYRDTGYVREGEAVPAAELQAAIDADAKAPK